MDGSTQETQRRFSAAAHTVTLLLHQTEEGGKISGKDMCCFLSLRRVETGPVLSSLYFGIFKRSKACGFPDRIER